MAISEGRQAPTVDELFEFLSTRASSPAFPPRDLSEAESLSFSSLPSQPEQSLKSLPATVGLAAVAADSCPVSQKPSRGKDPSLPPQVPSLAQSYADAAKSLPVEPPKVSPTPLTVPATFGPLQVAGSALVDSGSQADVLSPDLVARLGLEVFRLLAPVHADLAADGQSARLSLVADSSISVGSSLLADRRFFVCPLPPGIDALLGTPWMRDTGTAVSATQLFVAPSGPCESIYDFEHGRFADQPVRNLVDLGFTDEPMTDADFQNLVICAIAADLPSQEVINLVESVGLEPRNPLLDIDDDDSAQPDLSAEDAAIAVEALLARFADVFVDKLPGLPPFRPVNHHIPLVDPDKVIRSHAIRIPDRYKEQFRAHTRAFVAHGFWSPASVDSACAMFAVPKHDKSQARFVINLKPRNLNTKKFSTPLPDMMEVRNRLASHRFRSKIDFKQAYEQIRIAEDSVQFSGFVTPNGTFVSRVMQQGDSNAPETMHRVCEMMFRESIGRFLDAFYDDILVYSQTRRAHLRYLEIIFSTLRHYRFFISRSKVDIMVPRLEALGAIVDDEGVHVADDKIAKIRRWPVPKNRDDILRFLGFMQWMRDHIPRLNEIAACLTDLTKKGTQWVWTAQRQFAFETLRASIPDTLTPLDLSKLESGEERLYLFTDASIFGCGGWLGQGPDADSVRPFRYFSAKFNSAQKNYTTTDQELLGVLNGCKKMHEHLVGWHFVVRCDHEPLKTYWTQPPKQNRRSTRTWETLAEYDFEWSFIPGKINTAADALSRLAEFEESQQDLPVAEEPTPAADDDVPFASELTDQAQLRIAACQVALEALPQDTLASVEPGLPVRSFPLSLAPLAAKEVGTSLNAFSDSFITELREATSTDTLGAKILANPSAYPAYSIVDSLVFLGGADSLRLLVPAGRVSKAPNAATFYEAFIDHSHRALGHLGLDKTLEYVRSRFWWKNVVDHVTAFVRGCEPCSRGKSSTAKPFGLLHPLSTPARPWSKIGMDFVGGLPIVNSGGQAIDSILSVTCYLSKMVVLIPLPSTATASNVAALFLEHVYRRFGLPDAIVSDRDPKFTSAFWRALHARLGIRLKMSTSAHPQTDGRAEATNKVVGQILRVMCEDSPDSWLEVLPLCEFGINSAPASATSVAPFATIHGFIPHSLPSLASLPDSASSFAERARLNSLRATDAIIASRISMTHEANKHRRDEQDRFEVGSKAYISTSGLRLPKGISSKFVPRFIGPYTITGSVPATSSYTFALPPHLKVHPTFHASRLRPHLPNDDDIFPARALTEPPPVVPAVDGAEEEFEIERIVEDRTRRGKTEYRVRWLGYSPAEDMWRPEAELKATAPDALKAYKELKKLRGRRIGIAPLSKSPFSVHNSTAVPILKLPTASSRGGSVSLSPSVPTPTSTSPSSSDSLSFTGRIGLASVISTNRFAVLDDASSGSPALAPLQSTCLSPSRSSLLPSSSPSLQVTSVP